MKDPNISGLIQDQWVNKETQQLRNKGMNESQGSMA